MPPHLKDLLQILARIMVDAVFPAHAEAKSEESDIGETKGVTSVD